MLEQTGDFWAVLTDAYVITTNGNVNSQGRCVMGRGIAREAKNRFPGIDTYLGQLLRTKGNHVHYLGEWTRADGTPYTIFSFPVKHNYWEKASPNLIIQSAAELILEVPPSFQRVVMVRPGCGNGGRKWEHVRELLVPFLNDRFIIVEKNP